VQDFTTAEGYQPEQQPRLGNESSFNGTVFWLSEHVSCHRAGTNVS
jgi:hypothetical protein